MTDYGEAFVVEIDQATLAEVEAAVGSGDGTYYLYECGECNQRFTEEEFKMHSHEEDEESGGNELVINSQNVSAMIIKRPPTSRTISLKDITEENRPFQCMICLKPFMQASNLKRHMRTHTGEKPFKCPVCKKEFTQGNNLKAHMRIHSGERPFKCNYCEQSFTQGSNLKKHERSHTHPGFKPEKRFGCAQCGSYFADYSILKAHVRVHTKERPFVCNHCDARFSQESNLRRHYRTHTGERPFSCGECGKQFSQGNNLKAHMIIHSGDKPLTCPTCGARFSRAIKYQQHYREAHLSGKNNGQTGSVTAVNSESNDTAQFMDEHGNVITLEGSILDNAGSVIRIVRTEGTTATIIREGENGPEEHVVELVYETEDSDEVSDGQTVEAAAEESIKAAAENNENYIVLEASIKEEAQHEVPVGNELCDSVTVGTEEVSVAAVCEVGEAGEGDKRAARVEPRSGVHRIRNVKLSICTNRINSFNTRSL